MDKDPREIELEPFQYRQIEGPRRKEPFLAPGWKYGLLAILTLVAIKMAVILLR